MMRTSLVARSVVKPYSGTLGEGGYAQRNARYALRYANVY